MNVAQIERADCRGGQSKRSGHRAFAVDEMLLLGGRDRRRQTAGAADDQSYADERLHSRSRMYAHGITPTDGCPTPHADAPSGAALGLGKADARSRFSHAL